MAYNKLYRIAKSGVEEPAKGLADMERKFFRREAQQSCQRYNRQEVEDEGDRITPAQGSRNYSEWHKNQQYIYIIPNQHGKDLVINISGYALLLHRNMRVVTRGPAMPVAEQRSGFRGFGFGILDVCRFAGAKVRHLPARSMSAQSTP